MGTRKQTKMKKLILKLIPNLHEQSWRVEGGLGRKSKHTRIEGHGRYKPTEKQEQMKTPKRKNSKLRKKKKIKKPFLTGHHWEQSSRNERERSKGHAESSSSTNRNKKHFETTILVLRKSN